MWALVERLKLSIADFIRALRFSVIVVTKPAIFDELDSLPDVRLIQKQFLYVFSSMLFFINVIAVITVRNYADDVIDTIRSAICDRLAAIPNSRTSCFDDGYKHLLSVEENPTVDPATLGTAVQLLWEALSLSEAVQGYTPWLTLPVIFDYVVLPWVIPFAAAFIVWLGLIRKFETKERKYRIKRYATYLMMSCVAVPLLLLAPVQALGKVFERAEQNFPQSASRLTGPGYKRLKVGGEFLDEAPAITALQGLVRSGHKIIRLIAYLLYTILLILCVRMTLLLTAVMGQSSWKRVAPALCMFVFIMGRLL